MISEETRRRAVAASAAIYRVSDIPTFDPVLKFELRKRSLEVLTGVAGVGFRPEWASEGGHEAALRNIAGVKELLSFGIELKFVSSENGKRILGAYQHLEEDLAIEPSQEVAQQPPGFRASSDPEGIRLNSRQERILTYISEQGQAPISSICSMFGEEVSEKTIQRDLSELVGAKLIQRQGGNRWTTYISIGHKMSDRDI